MANFQLANKLPGIQIIAPDPLTLGATAVPVSIRFTDGLLWMPAGTLLTVNGRYNDPNNRLELSADFVANPVGFLGDQLKLNTLTLQIAVADDGASGNKVFNPNATKPIIATGQVNWESEMTAALGVSDNKLGFLLSYEFNSNGKSGFVLALDASRTAPISLSRIFVNLQGGSLRVDILPEEAALILTLTGDAALTPGEQFETQINSVLQTIFGANNTPALDPPPFVYQQKFKLQNTGLLGVPLELPKFSLIPGWSNGANPALNNFEGLDIKLGLPRFTFQLPMPGNPLPNLELSLYNSGIRFPDVHGLEAFNLSGNLNFVNPGTNGWSFSFEPDLPGAIPFPDIIQFFLAQLNWLQGQLPDLADLLDLLQVSQQEMDWYRLFQDLLDGLDPATFPAAFRAILEGAMVAPDAPSLERLFRLAFRALQSAGNQLFTPIWQVWFELRPDAWTDLIAILEMALIDLGADKFDLLLETLFGAAGLKLTEFFQALLVYGAEQFDNAFDAFLKLWLKLLVSASQVLGGEKLANSLWAVLINATGALVDFRPLADLPMFKGSSIYSMPSFNFRTDVLLIGLGFQGLILFSDLSNELLTFSDTVHLFERVFAPLINTYRIIFPEFPKIDATMVLGLITAFLANAEGDEAKELLILQMGRIFPLGILFALGGAIWNLIRPDHLVPWYRFLFNSIEEDNTLRVRRLPKPTVEGTGIKYLIFSDIHRDAAADQRPEFEIGSIDHFSVHKQLYLDILTYADEKGYTVIEAGDGEELWFIRDFSTHTGIANMLNNIILTHQSIYDKLADMHRRGKYIRLFGNHDSYLRQQRIFDILAAQFPDTDPEGKSFSIYDFVIIPGVKTMDDSAFDLILELWKAESKDWPSILENRLVLHRIGLDSDPYTSVKPLIVTHGHQWDFWNCDSNSLVGKLVANSVAVPLDMFNDPFIDVAGINYSGAPLIDFQDIFAGLPVVDNFPAHQPAVKFAHQIQHMPNTRRLPIDDIMYWETWPALVGLFAMPLTLFDDDGNEIQKWSEVFASDENADRFFSHLFNQLSIGHTHYPQAYPYFNIERMLFGDAAVVIQYIRAQIADILFGFEPNLNLVKTRYLNSGTAGWQEGVIWAIEINEHGEARLIYWTTESRIDRPHSMDWQLPRMDNHLREALNTKKREVQEYFQKLPDLFGKSLQEVLAKLSQEATLPFEVLVGLANQIATDPVTLHVTDTNLPRLAALSTVQIQQYIESQFSQISQWLLQLFLSLLRRQAPNPPNSNQTFTLTTPLPPEMQEALDRVKGYLQGVQLPGITSAQISNSLTQIACVWLLANHTAGILNKNRDLTSLLKSDYPVVWMVMTLVAILPAVNTETLPFTSSITTEDNLLKITLTLPAGGRT